VDVHVGGSDALDMGAWKRAWGRIGVVANLDMARVAALFPLQTVHIADIAGRVTLDGFVARDSLADTTPEIRLAITTEGLAATGESTAPLREPGGPLMVGPATWTLDGMDLRSSLVVDGADSAAEVAIRIVDKLGAIVSLDLKTDPLPFDALLSGKGDLVAQLESVRLSARVDVPSRDLTKLPPIVRPDGISGVAGATFTIEGTVASPRIDVAFSGRGIRSAAAADVKMDGDVKAHYDGAIAQVNAEVRSPDTRLLSLNAELHANARDLLAGTAASSPWTGAAKAELARFPLGAISALAANQVKGFVSGDFQVTGLHEHAGATANLVFADLQMGKAKFATGEVHATLDDSGLNAKTRLANAAGSLDAEAKMGMAWGKDIAPSADGSGLQAKIQAKHFPAAAVAPFAASAVSELTGWIDADASVALRPGQKPQMSGTVSFSDGVIDAPSMGENFHAVKARVTLTDDGVVKLQDVEASGLSGRLTASGSARLDGTTLRTAELSLDINKRSAIPLDIQGTNFGLVYGNIKVEATGAADGKTMTVAVNVPDFHVAMPEAGLPRSPQTLGNAPGVHLGVYRDPDRFIVLPVDGAPVVLVAERNAAVAKVPSAGGVVAPAAPPSGQAEAAKDPAPSTALDVTVHLGNVQIVRGQQVALNLDGALTAKVGAATVVRGQIRVKSGKLSVQSKEFEIEKGTVSFVGDDPSNPEVSVTAGWTAPDGTRVYADYVGPVKTGKVSLRSEPPRPKNEIVALILFGTADGSSATPYASKSPSTGTQAGTAVGGLGTDGLSKGLDQLTGMNVTAKIDTSDSANPRPEVEVQIAKDISLELAVVIGTPPPGSNPDTTYATVDWRFVRNWSVATTFGDQGSTFADLVWQYRY
jgi:translocation and assembly module TamB